MVPRSSPAEPDDDRTLYVNARVSIPRAELVVRATRASGAGGQHVNKTSSRVEITWNPSRSTALSDEERALIANRLASRISDSGDLRVVASDTRSQLQNRDLAESRLAELVRASLVVAKARKRTRPTRAAKQARLDEKRHTAHKKRDRGRWSDD